MKHPETQPSLSFHRVSEVIDAYQNSPCSKAKAVAEMIYEKIVAIQVLEEETVLGIRLYGTGNDFGVECLSEGKFLEYLKKHTLIIRSLELNRPEVNPFLPYFREWDDFLLGDETIVLTQKMRRELERLQKRLHFFTDSPTTNTKTLH